MPSTAVSMRDAAGDHRARVSVVAQKRFVGTTGQLAGSTDREMFRYWILLIISGSSSEVAPEVPT